MTKELNRFNKKESESTKQNNHKTAKKSYQVISEGTSESILSSTLNFQ